MTLATARTRPGGGPAGSGPPPGRPVPAIALAGVTARYKGAERPSVDRLSLTVQPGEILGLLGQNGSGKTTTINMCLGFMKPSRGTVTVFGHEPGSDPAKMLTGAVIQETALYDRLSARDNLRMYAALYPSIRKQDRPRVVDAALSLADLAHEAGKRAGDLSGGMARRLQIARALQHSPHLIILDEPTLGVDPVQRAALWEHIRWLRDTGRTVLLTTNQMDEAAALCDRIAIIHAGRLVALDTPANLQRGRGAVITVTAEAVEEDLRQAYKALCADPDITDVTVTHGAGPRLYQVRVTGGGGDGITGKVIMHLTGSEVVIRDVDTRKATLDEVFLAVTGSFQAAR